MLYLFNMDVSIRGMKESVWRTIRVAALAEGITIAVYIEQLVQHAKQEQPVAHAKQHRKTHKKKMHRNTLESQVINVTVDPVVARIYRQAGKDPDDLLSMDEWELQDEGLIKSRNVIKSIN